MKGADGFYKSCPRLSIRPDRLVLTPDRTLLPYGFICMESFSELIFYHSALSINPVRLVAAASSAWDDDGVVIVDVYKQL